MDNLIAAAYRQMFNEQQAIASNRNPLLESQLRSGQITVREFIRGLATSATFRQRNLEPNSNYRFVQICVQRILGREVYNEREKIAWSIVLATKGLQGLIDALVNSKEYLANFGDDTVPYQRRRILPQRDEGMLPFARVPRYDRDYLEKLVAMGNDFNPRRSVPGLTLAYRWDWQRPPYPAQARLVGGFLAKGGGALLGLGAIAVLLAYYGLLSL
jgi:phycobilisome rod-core linker protein